ncbi:MAG: TonB-dependent receptor, partial [Geminicoccaceae bacterium]|nr:TonB-dependent receptor [Geminicoccaceae bacterium]
MPATKASPIANDPPCAGALLALVALATLAALLPGRAGEAAEPCEPSVGRIVSLQGLVEVQPAGAADWARAGLDDRLCIGDTIRAGAYSQAAVALANDSVASLDQLTTMRFVGETESGRSWLDLLFGDVHLFSHRPRALEVDTPIANAFTEGTEFLVRARPERTEVILLDGRVRLASA